MDAQALCSSHNSMRLATIFSGTHSDALHSAVSAYTGDSYWIGANDRAAEGQWVWEDGQPLSYTRWNSGEPNNAGEEDCAHVSAANGWNDLPCTGIAIPFVCSSCEVRL